MKVQKETTVVERGGDVEETTFTIEANEYAFEILSAGLYSDRIGAIIRELAANASDAHVDAGTTHIPYLIHCPNYLEPYFKIRDFGTGLDPKQVKSLYSRYFASTKSNSNDFVGCMGLGSKSPFAYGDSFSVISYYNGQKYIFNSYKNERNCPAISLLGQEDTTEPNGLEVSFPVKSSDFSEFALKCAEKLKFFKNKPEIKGQTVCFEEYNYLIKTEEFGITDKRENESFVVMGNIAYPIEVDDFKSDYLTVPERKILNWGLHLFVAIGTVDVAASREKLTFTKNTRANIKKIIEAATDAAQEEAKKKFENITSLWEARVLLGKLKTGVMDDLCDWSSVIQWKNQEISNVIRFWDVKVKKPATTEMVSIDRDDFPSRRRRGRYNNTPKPSAEERKVHRWNVDSLEVKEDLLIFVNDIDKNQSTVIRQHLESIGRQKAYLFSEVPDEFIDYVDCRHAIVPLSTLPPPIKKPRAPRGSNGPSQRNNRTVLQKFSRYNFVNEEVDLSLGGVYIEVRHDKAKYYEVFGQEHYSFTSPEWLRSQTDYLTILGFGTEIYGVRPCDLKRLEKFTGWVSYHEYLKQTMDAVSDYVEKGQWYTKQFDPRFARLDSQDLAIGSPLIEAIEFAKTASEARQNTMIQAFMSLNEYTKTYKFERDVESFSKLSDKVYQTYPLLNKLSYWDDIAGEILHYVQLVDLERAVSDEMAA